VQFVVGVVREGDECFGALKQGRLTWPVVGEREFSHQEQRIAQVARLCLGELCSDPKQTQGISRWPAFAIACQMADKDVRRNPLASSVSGIPRRSAVSRLQTPTIRTRRSTPSLASTTPSTSSSVTQSVPLATSPSSRVRPIAEPNKFIPSPRSTTIASKASSTFRSQKSNGSLKPSASKPTSPVSRASRPTAATPRAAQPASHSPVPPRNQARKATAPLPNRYEGDQGDGSPLKGPLSIKEQIVARRAAMKKGSVSGASTSSTLTGLDGGGSAYSGVTRSGSGFSDWGLFGPDDVPSAHDADDAPDDLFGRPTIRQAVIKALSTGEPADTELYAEKI